VFANGMGPRGPSSGWSKGKRRALPSTSRRRSYTPVSDGVRPRRNRAGKAAWRINRSLRWRPQARPSASRSCPIRRAPSVRSLLRKPARTRISSCSSVSDTRWPTPPGIEASAPDTERLTQPSGRPNSSVLRDGGKRHSASIAKQAAAFFNMSRSAFSLMTSGLSRASSACSTFSCRWPGKACCESAVHSSTHRRNTVRAPLNRARLEAR
jgi:hypothetical protein